MTVTNLIIASLIIWNFLGAIALVVISDTVTRDLVNPMYLWNRFKVNVFGTIVLTLLFNLTCPIYSSIYWFRKLCTVGRKFTTSS